MSGNHSGGLSGGTNGERLRLVSRRGTRYGLVENTRYPDLFKPTIRIPVRSKQAESKRANTKT